MYCGNCGNEVMPNAVACMKCGANSKIAVNSCISCGSELMPNAVVCTSCGASVSRAGARGEGTSRLMVGLLGIFLGSFGIHNFILGYTGKAVAQLLITIFGSFIIIGPIVSWVWALIESIQILTKNVNEDANGIPLVD